VERRRFRADLDIHRGGQAAPALPSAPAEISYQFITDSSIIITPAQLLGFTDNVAIPFTIDGDTLTLLISGQNPLVLKRVK
jgi:hypothetical protein